MHAHSDRRELRIVFPEFPPEFPNRRPDVLGRYFDGRVDRVEVWSQTDDALVLSSRNAALDRQIIQQGYTPLVPRVVYPKRGQ